MKTNQGHRKLIKHIDDPRHVRELPFSCYERRPLLTNDVWREMLSRSIDAAADRHGWRLTAFVLMPEHVHLLFFPLPGFSKIEHLLKAIKRPYSYRIKRLLIEHKSPLLQRLTIRDSAGRDDVSLLAGRAWLRPEFGIGTRCAGGHRLHPS
jgi:putative transposase